MILYVESEVDLREIFDKQNQKCLSAAIQGVPCCESNYIIFYPDL